MESYEQSFFAALPMLPVGFAKRHHLPQLTRASKNGGPPASCRKSREERVPESPWGITGVRAKAACPCSLAPTILAKPRLRLPTSFATTMPCSPRRLRLIDESDAIRDQAAANPMNRLPRKLFGGLDRNKAHVGSAARPQTQSIIMAFAMAQRRARRRRPAVCAGNGRPSW